MPSLHLFCKVIDNFGDIGVCWRLARQCAAEHGWETTLWIDDLATCKRLAPLLDPDLADQCLDGIRVRLWDQHFPVVAAAEIPDLVVEGFGCRLPDPYLEAMAKRDPRPAWINLEYLSAEAWVESSHGLPSPHPRLPLVKHFFFPGFTNRTGGLLLERGLPNAREKFDASRRADFLQSLNIALQPEERLITLFCYPHAPLSSLFALLETGVRPTRVLVPEGVASAAMQDFLGANPVPGAQRSRGKLTLQVIPFLRQPDYDPLLWSADFNFVRGEDSFVRAQWARHPLCWHIYPQEEDAHRIKLQAFLYLYCAGLEAGLAAALRAVMLGWNGEGIPAEQWDQLWTPGGVAALSQHATTWAQTIRTPGDLATNLLRFARESC